MTTRSPQAPVRQAAAAIAAAFLDGDWEPGPMASRAGRALGDRRRAWLRDLALVAIHAFPMAPRDAPRDLRALLAHTDLLDDRWQADLDAGRTPWTVRLPAVPTAMGPTRWPVPVIDTVGDLAEMLCLAPTRLRWFADVRSLERTVADEPLRHYSYRWVTKRSGGARLLEAPKPILKLVQRRVLHEILDRIPPHPAAHGFRPGRSVHTFVHPHVGRPVVLRLDLEAFFASVPAGRVYGLFRRAGYPESVAHVLTGLTTNAVPLAVRRASGPVPGAARSAHRRLLQHLAHPHLPQGTPTSPALANLATFRLDTRLTALARSHGARYSRYADDLAFSGPARLQRQHDSFVGLVSTIVRDEGFRLHPGKTRLATRAQRQSLGGLVVNEHANLARPAYDRLKAVLHDAERNGPEAANRAGVDDFRNHLLGRIAWVTQANPQRGARLRASFDRITW